MKIFILGIIYLPESNCVKPYFWLTHNDRLTVCLSRITNYWEPWYFLRFGNLTLDKVSTDALTVNLNSAPILFWSCLY
jgi:hypothetical protein